MPFKKGQSGNPAGKKKGTTHKPRLSDYITPEEVKVLVEEAKTQAKEKPEILKFVLEHIFGKAPQQIDGDFTGELRVLISKEIADKNETDASTSKDSG